jgi:predicted esterase
MGLRSAFVLILAITCTVAAVPARGMADDAVAPSETAPPPEAPPSDAPTYSVYLPSSFTPDAKWPILICFDPAKRAMVPIELLREAAERHGFIIASSGSYDSADSVGRSIDQMAALWNDVIARYPIDFDRVYTAGFSGGSRICWLLDKMATKVDIAGIIGAGAGLPSRNFLEDWQPHLTYCGIVGLRDFNYYEMRWLDGELDRKKISHRLLTFDGGHEWPPAAICAEALDAMQIAAMQSRRIPADSSFVGEVYARELARIGQDEKAGRLVEALERADAAAEAFQGLRDVSGAREARERLARSKECVALRRARDARDRDAAARIDGALAALEDVRLARNAFERPTFAQLVQAIDLPALRIMGSDEDPEVRLAAERILGAIYVRAESAMPGELMRRGEPEGAAVLLRLAAEIEPGKPVVWYNLGCAYVRSGRQEDGLRALTRAVDLGFADADRMRDDPDLEAVRSDSTFVRLLQSIEAD